MSRVALPPLTEQTQGVVARLRELRSRVVGWVLVEGLGRVLWIALAILAADLAIDWLFRMDRPQRGVMLGLMVAAIGWCVYRWVVRPLSVPMSDDALALQVEATHRQLGQSMISALQLARLEDVEARGMSTTLVERTVVTGARAAEDVDFSEVLDRRQFQTNLLLLVAALAALAGLGVGVALNSGLSIWFQRNILLANAQWPQKTYLIIERAENGRVIFPRGEDWTQVVRVTDDSEVVPQSISLDFRGARNRSSQAMKKSGDRRFEATFTSVLEPFEFRARGGDATTDWVRVELVEQPALDELTLAVTPPAYTGGKEQILPTGRGPYFVLKGSRLELTGKGNKPLRRAALVREDQSWPLEVTPSNVVQGALEPDRLAAGQYVVELEDTLGLVSRRPASFGLRIRADREPRVRVRLVGVSGMVVPKARIPLLARVTDDFGLTSARIDYRWRGDDRQRSSGEGVVALDTSADRPRNTELSLETAFELEPLDIPTGSGLSFFVAALDNDDVSGPNQGKSPDFLVRVVTEDELRADLLRREKEQRQEFERLLKNQEDLITDGRALEAETRAAADLSPSQRDQLMQFQRRQKIIGGNVGGIAERFASILIEVDNNRLEASPEGDLHKRLNKIVGPLQTMSEESSPAALQLLDRTRRQADQPKERSAALAEALAKQEEIARQMREVLALMVDSESYQEAINLLHEVLKAEQDVHERTLKEREERMKRILDDKSPSSRGMP